ncbi:hypothetical protein [Tunicatimonas pelagia]|uniref:hypothetical protein n=1 Tax=Tunicatimonas pelagia TaxID=931531 RepID=UPI002665D01A|nr:hypothetical protein [Tunicatimonas pelagia]WKN43027.1 hypothetical protein P0M28_28720 [Tunicatimonas pelagia]
MSIPQPERKRNNAAKQRLALPYFVNLLKFSMLTGLLTLCSVNLEGQTLNYFYHVAVSNDYSINSITAIFQDEQGFL